MSDLDLIIQAAAATCLDYDSEDVTEDGIALYHQVSMHDHTGRLLKDNCGKVFDRYWNPLEHDEDAYRLMIGHKISLKYLEFCVIAGGCVGVGYRGDIAKATRRAITRAVIKKVL